VVLVIEEHVDERIANAAGRSECAHVITLCEDLSAARKKAIHATRDTYGQPLHASRERYLVIGFDDEVNVVALNGHVTGAKAILVGSCHGFAQMKRPATNAGKAIDETQRHVRRLMRSLIGAGPMANERGLRSRTASAGPRATVLAALEQAELRRHRLFSPSSRHELDFGQ
jgi:hypothetical protein